MRDHGRACLEMWQDVLIGQEVLAPLQPLSQLLQALFTHSQLQGLSELSVIQSYHDELAQIEMHSAEQSNRNFRGSGRPMRTLRCAPLDAHMDTP